jgi:hypothetical protein
MTITAGTVGEAQEAIMVGVQAGTGAALQAGIDGVTTGAGCAQSHERAMRGDTIGIVLASGDPEDIARAEGAEETIVNGIPGEIATRDLTLGVANNSGWAATLRT